MNELFQLLIRHSDLISLVLHAVEERRVSSETLVSAIKKAMEEASDAQMRQELTEGS